MTLCLPRAPNAGIVDEQPSASEQDAVSAHGETILVVEDQPELLRQIEMFLDGLGYWILKAADGAAARKLLKTGETVDLLLTDVVTPNGVSGLDPVRHARRQGRDLKIVMMSGYVRDPDSAAGFPANLVFLEKAVPPAAARQDDYPRPQRQRSMTSYLVDASHQDFETIGGMRT